MKDSVIYLEKGFRAIRNIQYISKHVFQKKVFKVFLAQQVWHVIFKNKKENSY